MLEAAAARPLHIRDRQKPVSRSVKRPSLTGQALLQRVRSVLRSPLQCSVGELGYLLPSGAEFGISESD
jgi:hypothetical protein